MLETALTAFTTFFAVIGPIDTAVLLASMTPNMTGAERRAIAMKAVFIATIIILLFALFGGPVLKQLGVSLAALQNSAIKQREGYSCIVVTSAVPPFTSFATATISFPEDATTSPSNEVKEPSHSMQFIS